MCFVFNFNVQTTVIVCPHEKILGAKGLYTFAVENHGNDHEDYDGVASWQWLSKLIDCYYGF